MTISLSKTKFNALRKRIISILASNAFKAATLTPLALAMIACKTETIETPVIDVIQLSDLQINLGSNLKVGSDISAQTIRQGISANLSINDGEEQRKNLEELFNEFKGKKTFNITVTNNGESVYAITKDGMPTNGYTFSKEENNFKVSVNIGDDSFSFSKAFSVAPKEQQTPEQGGHEEGKDPTENPDEPNPPVTENPEQKTETINKEFKSLREVFEYTGMPEGNQQTGTITLTAQTIKKLAGLPSDLKIEATVNKTATAEEKEAKLKAVALAKYEEYKDLSTLIDAYDNGEIKVEKSEDYKQVEYMDENNRLDMLEIPQYKILSTLDDNKEIKLDGDFYYAEMIIDASNLNINVDDAKFFMAKNHKYKIYVEDLMSLYTKLQDKELNNDNILKGKIDDYKTPSLNFDIAYIDNIDMKDIASLYKIYEKENKLSNIQISYDIQKPVVLDGNENKEDAFLFKGNALRSELTSEEKSDLPNISVNVLLKLVKLGGNRYFKNLVVTGNYSEAKDESVDINSELTNVVFTGNVSGLKNSQRNQFNGVVYFMDKPYNNRKGDFLGDDIRGLLKLDRLEGVSYDAFRVDNGVLDLRGRDDLGYNPLKGYNIETESKKGINHYGHNAIYFTEKYVDNIEGIDSNSSIEEKFETLTRRVQRVGQGGYGVYNIYVDNKKYDSIADDISGLNIDRHAVSATPRSLEEFEYYGNNGKFKTPAYDSYNIDGVHPDIIEKLKKDKDSGAYSIP